jgi:hypothetical protein
VIAPLLARIAGEPALGTRLRLLVGSLVADAAEDLTLHRLCFTSDLDADAAVVGTFRGDIREDLRRLYVGVAGTGEDEELLAVIETLTLGVWHFAMRPKGLERLPILMGAVDAWLADTLFDAWLADTLFDA